MKRTTMYKKLLDGFLDGITIMDYKRIEVALFVRMLINDTTLPMDDFDEIISYLKEKDRDIYYETVKFRDDIAKVENAICNYYRED